MQNNTAKSSSSLVTAQHLSRDDDDEDFVKVSR